MTPSTSGADVLNGGSADAITSTYSGVGIHSGGYSFPDRAHIVGRQLSAFRADHMASSARMGEVFTLRAPGEILDVVVGLVEVEMVHRGGVFDLRQEGRGDKAMNGPGGHNAVFAKQDDGITAVLKLEFEHPPLAQSEAGTSSDHHVQTPDPSPVAHLVEALEAGDGLPGLLDGGEIEAKLGDCHQDAPRLVATAPGAGYTRAPSHFSDNLSLGKH